MLLFGRSKQEKILNLMLIIVAAIMIINGAMLLIFNPPTKFYSTVFFNMVYFMGLLHLRVKYLIREEAYDKIRRELKSVGYGDAEIRAYIEAKKEWDIYKSWVALTMLVGLLILFVYWLIP